MKKIFAVLSWFPIILSLALAGALGGPLAGQAMPPSLFAGLRWRSIGPYRGGRVTSVAGVPGQPAIYYFGTPGGGVWKSVDAGVTWHPIFDAEHVAAIGALAIAPSNPNIIYVATGEQTPGRGIYRSNDAGRSWTHLGLRHSGYITSLLVDAKHPNRLYAGVAGSPFHPGPERGVYRSTDGGKTWKRVLFRDNYSGVADMSWDPAHPKVILAAIWRRYAPRPGTKPPKFTSPDGEIYKTTNGGKSWQPLTNGLPAKNPGRIGVAIAAGTHDRRCYAILTQGLYRSDDGGAHWRKITNDPRVKGNGYFSRVFADPSRPDVVYVMQTSMYRSTDGGQHFISFKGAPGGDDNHVLWISPRNPQRLFLGSDQGATLSLDGGRSWSSWYTQPTGQFYNAFTDRQFPYSVYGAQQDSGTAGVLSRSDYGEISYRDWMPIGGFEYCFIAPDPRNPRYIYSGGWYGSVVRFDRKTGQVIHIFERGQGYRTAWAPAIIFSPQDPKRLYLGTQYLMATSDNGKSWQTLSPDLTARPKPATAAPAAKKKPKKPSPPKGFIFSIAPSPRHAGLIWIGSSNGLIHLTRDGGKSWTNVTPPGITRYQAIERLDASAEAAGTAYAAVSDDSVFIGARNPKPYIYCTHDYGQSWQLIVNGLPADQPVLAVRQDTENPSLLFAGTQTGAWVSFNAGALWQPLQLNLPTSQVTGLTVHQNDLVASTFGRGFWILDDITPLRQLTAEMASSAAVLFKPETAVRARWDNYQDTPLPPEIPAGQNPPNGAILDYELSSAPSGPVTLTIRNAQGRLVRRFSSVPAAAKHPLLANVPSYWIAPRTRLSAHAGLNRFVWDLHYPPPQVLRYGYFGAHLKYTEYTLTNDAILGQTPRHEPRGPLAIPGMYRVKLTVNGQAYSQPLRIVADPRIPASAADLQAQFAMAQQITGALADSARLFHAARPGYKQIEAQWKALSPAARKSPAGKAANARLKKWRLLINGTPKLPGLGTVNRGLARLLSDVESGDAAPVPTMQNLLNFNLQALQAKTVDWNKMRAAGKP